VAPELSLLRGIWFCAEAIPLDTNNATAANMAEYFLMSSFIFLSSDPQTNAGTGQAFRAIRRARAKFPDAQQLFPCPPFSGGYRRAYRPAAMVKFGARYATSLTFTGTTRLYGETRPGRQPGLAANSGKRGARALHLRRRGTKLVQHALAQSFGIALAGLCKIHDPACQHFVGEVVAIS